MADVALQRPQSSIQRSHPHELIQADFCVIRVPLVRAEFPLFGHGVVDAGNVRGKRFRITLEPVVPEKHRSG